MRPRTAVLALGVALAGCVTGVRMFDTRGTGIVRCYHASEDELWAALERGVVETGLVLERLDRDNGIVLAHSYRPDEVDPEEMALDADQGERIAVFVAAEGIDVWGVEIVNRAIFALDVTPRDWTAALFFTIEKRLPNGGKADNDELAACTRGHASELRGRHD
jgi:hypothetical protein